MPQVYITLRQDEIAQRSLLMIVLLQILVAALVPVILERCGYKV